MISVFISYSTRDECGKKYAKQLADDLADYGIKVCADLPNYRPQNFIGEPWYDAFTELIPDQDYYILVVTETFASSNAMKEFKRFKSCPECCQGVCGRSRNNCKLKKIIPCFFVEPKNVPEPIRAIGGIREFVEDYVVGFMELIRIIFPNFESLSLSVNEIGEIINFCKELEESLTDILKNHNIITKILSKSEDKLEEKDLEVAYYQFENFIRETGIEKVFRLYRKAPDPIKAHLEIRLLRELKRFICEAEKDIRKVEGIKLVRVEEMINELNKRIKELCNLLKKCEVRL